MHLIGMLPCFLTQQLIPSSCLITVGYKFGHWLGLGGGNLYQEAAGKGAGVSEGLEWFLESGQEQHASLCHSRSWEWYLVWNPARLPWVDKWRPFLNFLFGQVSSLGNYYDSCKNFPSIWVGQQTKHYHHFIFLLLAKCVLCRGDTLCSSLWVEQSSNKSSGL